MGGKKERNDNGKSNMKRSKFKNGMSSQEQNTDELTFDDNKKNIDVLIPACYEKDGMLGEDSDDKWNNSEAWFNYSS